MFEKIRKLLAELLKVEEEKITPEAKLVQDLGLDSLDSIELLLTLEEQYNVRIPDEIYRNFVTVGDVVSYFEST